MSSGCGCHGKQPQTPTERRILQQALFLNVCMAMVGGVGGWIARSTGLWADALDMLADAMAYAIALVAWNKSQRFKANAALTSGSVLLLLGFGVLIEAAQRATHGTAEPQGFGMMAVATVSLAVNSWVLAKLSPVQSGEAFLRATWLFTRADVIANLGVIAAGLLVHLLHSPVPDFVIGILIGLYVIKEAVEILRNAQEARA